tara:strand:+ start:8948 stop:9214 length:267 start_codon:yes stop_codon:yes gene_type:complete
MLTLAKKESRMDTSDITHPKHYNTGVIETIELIKSSMPIDAYKGYLMGNILKYVCRHKHKNPAEPWKDLKKAEWYLAALIREEANNGE